MIRGQNMKNETIIIILLVIILAVVCWSTFGIKEPVEESEVNVIGIAKTNITPDVVTVSLGVSSEGNTIKEALSKDNTTMTKITDNIKKLGIENEDIQTTNFFATPNYDYSIQPPKKTGYTVSHDITVKLNASKASELVTVTADAGATNFYNFTFSVSNIDEIKNGLLNKALDDAKAKAQTIAQNLQKSVKEYKVVSYEFVPQRDIVSPYAGGMGASGLGEETTPIQTGTNEVSVKVYVTFILE